MQTSYNLNFSRAFVGMLADSSQVKEALSLQAQTSLKLGRGVVKGIGADYTCRYLSANQGKITFDADIVTSNVVNMLVNLVAIAPVTFSVSHAATMALICVAIAAVPGVASATVSSAREITVTGVDGTAISVTGILVTLGATQANGTFAAGTRDTNIYGITLHTHATEQSSAGLVEIKATEPASVLRKGVVMAYTEDSVTSEDPVYCRYIANGTGKEIGQFLKTADSGKALLLTGVKFRSTVTVAGPVEIEINLP